MGYMRAILYGPAYTLSLSDKCILVQMIFTAGVGLVHFLICTIPRLYDIRLWYWFTALWFLTLWHMSPVHLDWDLHRVVRMIGQCLPSKTWRLGLYGVASCFGCTTICTLTISSTLWIHLDSFTIYSSSHAKQRSCNAMCMFGKLFAWCSASMALACSSNMLSWSTIYERTSSCYSKVT